jgi:branched-chain amino acid transport system substrate-binding protein
MTKRLIDPKSGLSRRKMLVTTGAAGALASTIGAPAILAQTRKPLRLGVLNSFSGAIAYAADNYLNGLSLYFESVGGMIAGRKVELLKEDDQFNPQIGLQKAKKFVESDEVDMLVGAQASNVALAVLNYARQRRAFYIVNAGTDSLTYDPYPYLFRTSLSSWQLSEPMAGWVHGNLAQEVVTVASDYAGGRDVIAGFKGPFTAKGGKVIKEIFPPLGTKDFSPYLTDIRSINPKATYIFLPGADLIRYMQQFREFGLHEKIPVTGFALVDSLTIKNLGQNAVGLLTTTIYTDTVDTPENKKFAPAYHAKYKDYPDLFSDYGFVAARFIAEGVKAVDGDTSNKDKLAEAMLKVTFNAPRGPFRLDPATHNPIQNVYVCKVAQLEGGRIGSQIVAVVKDVKDPGKNRG